MATIRRRETAKDKTGKVKTRFQAQIRRKGAPPITQTFSRKTDAKKWAEQVEAQIKVGKFLPRVAAEQHTVAEAIDRYLEDYIGELSEHEALTRRARLRWWRKKVGMLSMASLSPSVIADVRDSLIRGDSPTGEKLSGPTANRYTASLSAVLKVAIRDLGWLEENPARRITRKKESNGRVRFLGQKDDPKKKKEEGEQERLTKACRESWEPRLYSLVLFAMTTGARQGELLALKWKDVDLTGDLPRATLENTKNRDRRAIFFPGAAGSVLREMYRTPHISGFVFASQQGKPTFPKRAWEAALTAAKIDDFRFHDLRHTAASYLAMSGATLMEIQAVLGHRTLQMVKRYSHLTDEHSAQAVERMADRFLEGS